MAEIHTSKFVNSFQKEARDKESSHLKQTLTYALSQGFRLDKSTSTNFCSISNVRESSGIQQLSRLRKSEWSNDRRLEGVSSLLTVTLPPSRLIFNPKVDKGRKNKFWLGKTCLSPDNSSSPPPPLPSNIESMEGISPWIPKIEPPEKWCRREAF